jgi:hypothetical protein
MLERAVIPIPRSRERDLTMGDGSHDEIRLSKASSERPSPATAGSG